MRRRRGPSAACGMTDGDVARTLDSYTARRLQKFKCAITNMQIAVQIPPAADAEDRTCLRFRGGAPIANSIG